MAVAKDITQGTWGLMCIIGCIIHGVGDLGFGCLSPKGPEAGNNNHLIRTQINFTKKNCLICFNTIFSCPEAALEV